MCKPLLFRSLVQPNTNTRLDSRERLCIEFEFRTPLMYSVLFTDG